jgi:hypothetical protein
LSWSRPGSCISPRWASCTGRKALRDNSLGLVFSPLFLVLLIGQVVLIG